MLIDEIKENQFNSKADFQKALVDLCKPIIPHLDKNKGLLNLPSYVATHYNDLSLCVESIARLLWGLAPYSKGYSDDKVLKTVEQMIINGTNPKHNEYWGEIHDYDQRIVEMPPVALYLYFSKKSFWDNITNQEKLNIQNWLLQINDKKVVENNWLFFGVIINTILMKIGSKYSYTAITKNLNAIEDFYLGDGWYSDGETNQRDYYVSFAIHFYSLIYAKLMENEDKVKSNLYKKRAKKFAKDYIYWFSEDGSAIPFGRSLTYRFAQTAFWSGIAFAEVDAFPLGVIKGIISRHLRWWFQQPIFDNNGLLTVGYTYPNIIMSEEYNGSGSPYWALKSFLILGLDEDHQFWKVKEEKMPNMQKKIYQKHPRMILCRDSNHVTAFVNGQNNNGGHTHVVEKYEKFAYSNIFGFSVSRSEYGLSHGAYDSTLAISEDGETFKARHNLTSINNNEKLMYSKWNPWKDVEIESYIIPNLPWHVRIHKINTQREILLHEGGFSIEQKSHLNPPIQRNISEKRDGVGISYNEKHSGIVSLFGNGVPKVIFPVPNTNLLYPRTELPTLTWKLSKGSFIIVSGVLGDVNPQRNIDNYWNDEPKISIDKNCIQIFINGVVEKIDFDKKFQEPSSWYRKLVNVKKQITSVIKKIKRI